MDNWTIEIVEERLVEAAAVIRRLPPVRVPAYFNTWPQMVVEFADRVGQQPEPMRLPPPSPSAISRMEETLGWLRWLEAEHAKLVWARADRTPWKAICWQFGVARATANRRYQYGLSVIAWRLNGRKVPAKWSRRFLVAVAEVMPSIKPCPVLGRSGSGPRGGTGRLCRKCRVARRNFTPGRSQIRA